MPKIVDREAMQARIIAAAMAAFRQHGYAAAKMADIAREAGLAKGTLYLYFKSKEALTQALIDAFFSAWERALSDMPPPESLEDMAEQLRFAALPDAQSRAEIRMFFEIIGAGTRSEGLLAAVSAFHDRLGGFYTEQVSALKADGVVREDVVPELAGRALAAMFDGMAIHRSLFIEDTDRYEALVTQAVAVLVDGLRADPAP